MTSKYGLMSTSLGHLVTSPDSESKINTLPSIRTPRLPESSSDNNFSIAKLSDSEFERGSLKMDQKSLMCSESTNENYSDLPVLPEDTLEMEEAENRLANKSLHQEDFVRAGKLYDVMVPPPDAGPETTLKYKKARARGVIPVSNLRDVLTKHDMYVEAPIPATNRKMENTIPSTKQEERFSKVEQTPSESVSVANESTRHSGKPEESDRSERFVGYSTPVNTNQFFVSSTGNVTCTPIPSQTGSNEILTVVRSQPNSDVKRSDSRSNASTPLLLSEWDTQSSSNISMCKLTTISKSSSEANSSSVYRDFKRQGKVMTNEEVQEQSDRSVNESEESEINFFKPLTLEDSLDDISEEILPTFEIGDEGMEADVISVREPETRQGGIDPKQLRRSPRHSVHSVRKSLSALQNSDDLNRDLVDASKITEHGSVDVAADIQIPLVSQELENDVATDAQLPDIEVSEVAVNNTHIGLDSLVREICRTSKSKIMSLRPSGDRSVLYHYTTKRKVESLTEGPQSSLQFQTTDRNKDISKSKMEKQFKGNSCTSIDPIFRQSLVSSFKNSKSSHVDVQLSKHLESSDGQVNNTINIEPLSTTLGGHLMCSQGNAKSADNICNTISTLYDRDVGSTEKPNGAGVLNLAEASASMKSPVDTTQLNKVNFDPSLFSSTEYLVHQEKISDLMELKGIKLTPKQLDIVHETINKKVTKFMNNLRENSSRPLGMYTYKELAAALRSESLIGDGKYNLLLVMASSWTVRQMKKAEGVLCPHRLDPMEDMP